MKVGFVAPMSIAAVNGGLRAQALFTISHIREFGVEPVLISPWEHFDRNSVDLVHVFGATIENVGIVDQLALTKLPVVLSPVFYANRSAGFIKNTFMFEKLISRFGRGIRSDFGIRGELCDKANLLLPNTSEEALMIKKGFSIPEEKIRIIPNGVESRFSEASPDLFLQKYGLKDFVLFVGQAGARRKNIVKLLEIAPEVEADIVIIGSFLDDEYGNFCQQLAEKTGNVTLIETLEHDSELLSSAYAASKVFVLPSYYETPGIAAMEAALTGSQIVITERGGTIDYFGDHAIYINPNSSDSILEGIKKALSNERSDALKNHILVNYSWQKVAEKTVEAYKTILR